MFRSLEKSLRLFIISVFLIICMPLIAYAAPDGNNNNSVDNGENVSYTEDQGSVKDSFFEVFSLDETNLIYSEPDVNIYVSSDADINSFTNLYLNKGFEGKDNENVIKSNFIDAKPTFDSSHNIKGNGNEGTIVGILVYDSWGEEGNLNITYQTDYQTIGPSGIYDEKIYLNTIGINYVCLAVKKADNIEYNIYMINRKKEETKEILENIEIKFDGLDSEDNQIENEDIIDNNAFDLLN